GRFLALSPSSQPHGNGVQAFQGQLLRLAQVGVVKPSSPFAVGLPVRSAVWPGFFACREAAALSDKGKERSLLQPAIPRRSPHSELVLMDIHIPGQYLTSYS